MAARRPTHCSMRPAVSSSPASGQDFCLDHWQRPAAARAQPGQQLARALDLGAVGLKPCDELLWVTQRGRMAAVQLVGRDAQPLPDHLALELRRKEPVIPAKEEPGRHIGPGSQRPWLLKRRRRLAAYP